MAKIKFETIASTVGDAVSTAWSELTSLAEECREMVDNAGDGGLSQTQRIQTLGETADTLEGLSEPDVPAELADIPMTYSEQQPRRKGRGLSRADRCSNACMILEAVTAALDEKTEDPDFDKSDLKDNEDDIDTLRGECDEIKSSAEGCEFPGMYG